MISEFKNKISKARFDKNYDNYSILVIGLCEYIKNMSDIDIGHYEEIGCSLSLFPPLDESKTIQDYDQLDPLDDELDVLFVNNELMICDDMIDINRKNLKMLNQSRKYLRSLKKYL